MMDRRVKPGGDERAKSAVERKIWRVPSKRKQHQVVTKADLLLAPPAGSPMNSSFKATRLESLGQKQNETRRRTDLGNLVHTDGRDGDGLIFVAGSAHCDLRP
jgi:hypothetical protein